MENISVVMIRPHLRDIPQFDLPSGYRIRPLRGESEAALWTDIVRDSETFFEIKDDLFKKQFGDDLPTTKQRIFIVEREAAGQELGGAVPEAVGTIGAWKDPEGEFTAREGWGRIHWVAVRPAAQGGGIGKGMMTHAMNALTALGHEKAVLGTSTGRLAALKIYLDFGFVPHLNTPEAEGAWRSVTAVLSHPALPL